MHAAPPELSVPCRPHGCQWKVDRLHCLSNARWAANISLLETARRCLATEGCVGFEIAEVVTDDAVVGSSRIFQGRLKSTTDVGGDTPCWVYRKQYPNMLRDPYVTSFHFQPSLGNFMNDPSAPFFHRGLYHLFYGWNPRCTRLWIFCSREWGHAVSTDMIHWAELPVALNASEFGACGGVWSGSAIPSARVTGSPMLFYSVACNSCALAYDPN